MKYCHFYRSFFISHSQNAMLVLLPASQILRQAAETRVKGILWNWVGGELESSDDPFQLHWWQGRLSTGTILLLFDKQLNTSRICFVNISSWHQLDARWCYVQIIISIVFIVFSSSTLSLHCSLGLLPLFLSLLYLAWPRLLSSNVDLKRRYRNGLNKWMNEWMEFTVLEFIWHLFTF